MLDKNECNISEETKIILDEKYGKDCWELEAVKVDIKGMVCDYCCLGENKIVSCSVVNKCSSVVRKDKTEVYYKLHLKEPEILEPDFSKAEVGDEVQNINGNKGIITDVCHNLRALKIKHNGCMGDIEKLYPFDGRNRTILPVWFYGSFKQFPTKENCLPPERLPKTKQYTVSELENMLGEKIEIVSEK